MGMEIETFFIEGPKLIKPTLFKDERGCFLEGFSKEKYENILGVSFLQDNISLSKKYVLRGLHFQSPPMDQAKLVSVLSGSVLDVAVDIRSGSTTYGKYIMVELDSKHFHQFFIPSGFAHGFIALEEDTIFSYKCSQYYSKSNEGTLRWDDSDLAIDWPKNIPFILSPKDQLGQIFNTFKSPF